MTAFPRDRALEAFGFRSEAFGSESIYKDGLVFRGVVDGRDVVIKRTRSPRAMAERLFGWTQHLANAGIRVVVPDTTFDPNVIELDGDVWVVYPFVHGSRYTGSAVEIDAAGRLLGDLHATSSDDSLLPRLEADELEAAELPCVTASWDYKANNLVYTSETEPVFVDPDSAGVLPRVLDLALAALLFHNDAPDAPGRLFSANEWRSFYKGYCECVELTAAEKRSWPAALRYMWSDEALWLLDNDPDGWSDARQRSFLNDLRTSDLDQFEI